MIAWSELSKTLERMHGMHLKNLEIQTCSADLQHYPLVTSPPPAVATTVISLLPATPPVIVSPAPAVIEVAPAPAPPPPEQPKAREINLTTAKHSIDPIVLGIGLVDPMYEGAPHTTRHNIEKEIAVKVESELDAIYKSNSGRSRGWTKVGLEAMIKPRCASGGDLKELDRAKKPFIWALAQTDKCMSAFLDFVCCARRIHLVIMDTEKHIGYLYPAADILADADGEKPADYPLFLVNNTGHPMFGIRNSAELLAYVDKNNWKVLPPHSVVHSLSGLKLDELESVGKRLGMSVVEGSKAERVAAISAYKTRARLVSH
jgi:hypothetical protein